MFYGLWNATDQIQDFPFTEKHDALLLRMADMTLVVQDLWWNNFSHQFESWISEGVFGQKAYAFAMFAYPLEAPPPPSCPVSLQGFPTCKLNCVFSRL